MEMEKKKLKREWVKTAAIIFLSVLLVLTFFSNTIMNHSLPEVAAENVGSGTIQAKIRGSGTVIANEAYEVTLKQSREVESVRVRVGDQVMPGDVLFVLGSMDSEELRQARQTLKDLEVAYQQRLLAQGNADSTEQRQIRELRQAYDDALAVYHLYSTKDPASIEMTIRDSEKNLREKEQRAARLEAEVSGKESQLQELRAEEEIRLAKLKALETEIENGELRIESLQATMTVLNRDREQYLETMLQMETAAAANRGEQTLQEKMDAYVHRPELLQQEGSLSAEEASACIRAYNILTADLEAVMNYLDSKSDAEAPAALDFDGNETFEEKYAAVSAAQAAQINTTEQNVALARQEHEEISKKSADLSAKEQELEQLRLESREAAQAVADQREVVASNQAAREAAQAVTAAKAALDDKLFEASLEDPESLTLAADRAKIQEQQALVTKLSEDADGAEVVAKVAGTVSEIQASAGAMAQADSPIAVITVADRGYLVKIPVTNEQARKVHVGDPAEVANFYWGNITATLENITPDPATQGKGKLLLFRVSGDGVESGTNLTLSIGQKSATYDCLIPNSAVRTDSNGTFVLVVEAKSSPLGNRYIATRAEVKVLAADDTQSAVSGLAYGDFVITTSTKPLEAGDQIRLVDQS